MKRREAVVRVLSLVALPLMASAQGRPLRIGALPDFIEPFGGWFYEAMRELGWRKGRDFVLIETGFPFGHQIEPAAKRIVAEAPDIIFTVNTGYALAAHRLTKTIPIVMWTSGYPVEVGLAESLARPGKNVTGNTNYAGTGVWGKMLELLRELKPSTQCIGVIWDYVPPAHPREEVEPPHRELRRAGKQLGVRIHIVEVAHPDAAPEALGEVAAARPDALVVTTGTPLFNLQAKLMQFAVEKRLPTIVDFPWRPAIQPQPLLVFAPSARDLIHRAVAYVDRIAKGAKAGELPIQQPAKFELVVNMKTAKVLSLTVPSSILVRADRVVE
ncbi:MAG: ABC transporter substrate-binding protein [Propylenella sp.]